MRWPNKHVAQLLWLDGVRETCRNQLTLIQNPDCQEGDMLTCLPDTPLMLSRRNVMRTRFNGRASLVAQNLRSVKRFRAATVTERYVLSK
jgi:hypothetical protein